MKDEEWMFLWVNRRSMVLGHEFDQIDAYGGRMLDTPKPIGEEFLWIDSAAKWSALLYPIINFNLHPHSYRTTSSKKSVGQGLPDKHKQNRLQWGVVGLPLGYGNGNRNQYWYTTYCRIYGHFSSSNLRDKSHLTAAHHLAMAAMNPRCCHGCLTSHKGSLQLCWQGSFPLKVPTEENLIW